MSPLLHMWRPWTMYNRNRVNTAGCWQPFFVCKRCTMPVTSTGCRPLLTINNKTIKLYVERTTVLSILSTVCCASWRLTDSLLLLAPSVGWCKGLTLQYSVWRDVRHPLHTCKDVGRTCIDTIVAYLATLHQQQLGLVARDRWMNDSRSATATLTECRCVCLEGLTSNMNTLSVSSSPAQILCQSDSLRLS